MMPAPLSPADYPGLDPADVGLYPNVGYGTAESVRAHCIEGGATAVLVSDMTAGQTTLEISDAARFPAAPFTVQVSGERMLVTGVSGTTFTVTRGYGGTLATAHASGRTVFEVRTEYVYLVSPEPVKEIKRVYVDGVLQDTGYTAYTGQDGDEHPDWPGMAVVAFSAEVCIGRQYNGEGGAAEAEAECTAASHRALVGGGGGPGVPFGGKRNVKLWALFTGSGELTSQFHRADVRNPGAADAVATASVVDPATGEVLRRERFLVPAGGTRTIEVGLEGGPWGTVMVLTAVQELEASGMKKIVVAIGPPEGEDYETYPPPAALTTLGGAGGEDTPVMRPAGRAVHMAAYPSTSAGAVSWQTHRAEVENTGAGEAVARLIAVEPGGAPVAARVAGVAAGEAQTLELAHKGGGWDTATKLVLVSGELRLASLSKEVAYIRPGSSASDALYSSSARAVVGEEVTVDAGWAVDLSGGYGGPGTLIERPDHVMRHFIVERMGFAEDEVDAASFEAAGAAYASAVEGGCRFGFVIREKITPSEFLRELARQCRSVVDYRGGRWRLACLPEEAPGPVKAISYKDLAGEGAMFEFSKTPLDELSNSITAYYRADYAGSGWLASAVAADEAFQSLYGPRKSEIYLPAVRDRATAEHVLAHVLKERKAPLLTVRFTVFWDGFLGLGVGDTIEIENPLYGGRRWFVERVTRIDKFRAEVEARQWR